MNGSKNRGRRGGYLVVAAVTACAFLASPARSIAHDFFVGDGDVPALINAINVANTNGEADVINLAAGGIYTLTELDNDTDGPNGLPSVTSEITINGNEATIERSAGAGTPDFRILHVGATGSLTLNGVTVTGGSPLDDGGGIRNAGGSLTLNGSTITGNTAMGNGGGVLSVGTTVMSQTTVAANTGDSAIGAAGDTTIVACSIVDNVLTGTFPRAVSAGGIDATVIITGSTISGNTGTGIDVPRETPTFLTNTTISENLAHGLRFYLSSAELTNCTVNGNGLAGLYSEDAATATLKNTIVANNGTWDCDTFTAGLYINDGGFNLVADGTGISHPTSMSGDPRLGPLADNGGPTMTHALLPGSIAIDAGDCAGGTVGVDQRGVPRPMGAGCDIGAFEVGIVVSLDIKPGSCPNPLNSTSRGVLPVAVVGSGKFDVNGIDVATIRLSRADGVGGSVSPHEGSPGPHSTFEDVATPFEGEACDCHDWAGDGIDDLSMKFRTQAVVEAFQLNNANGGEPVELEIRGNLVDGTPFVARDCVRLVPVKRNSDKRSRNRGREDERKEPNRLSRRILGR